MHTEDLEATFTKTIPAGGYFAQVVKKGHRLRIVDLHGGQGVDFLCYNANRPEERYHAPNTLKAARDLQLTVGHRLYSDEARGLFLMVADTCPGHDTLAGCCSAPSNQMLYGVRDCPGCRENFLKALKPFGLGRRDIVPNINFFCDVPVSADQRLLDMVFGDSPSKAGDYVELEAEMDALAVISNCPQINNPCNGMNPTEIQVTIFNPG